MSAITNNMPECAYYRMTGNCITPGCNLTHTKRNPKVPLKLKLRTTTGEFNPEEKTKIKKTSTSFVPPKNLIGELSTGPTL